MICYIVNPLQLSKWKSESKSCVLEDEAGSLDLVNWKGRNQKQKEQLGELMLPLTEQKGYPEFWQ